MDVLLTTSHSTKLIVWFDGLLTHGQITADIKREIDRNEMKSKGKENVNEANEKYWLIHQG
jgi:hypothetical protein